MTTVVWDGRYLAADGQTTNGEMIVSHTTRKLRQELVGDGFITIGFSGVEPDKEKLIKCALAGEKSKKRLNANLITVEAGLVAYMHGRDSKEYWKSECKNPEVIGSGAKYACAALDLGQNAMGAVKVATGRDIYTGGTITFYDTQNPDLGIQVCNQTTNTLT